jgi:hypothetical protein
MDAFHRIAEQTGRGLAIMRHGRKVGLHGASAPGFAICGLPPASSASFTATRAPAALFATFADPDRSI